MALPSIKDRVGQILTRRLVEDKVRGGAPAAQEAAAVIETVALNLFLNPRAVLYLTHLARNSLVTSLANEIAAIRDVAASVKDLANPSYAIKNVSALRRAQTALLQIEGHQRLVLGGGPWQSYDQAVNEFLNKQLSRNVRRVGSSQLTRPGSESGNELPGLVSVLQDAHADVLDRLYSLVVGVDNFLASSYHTLIGVTSVFRARKDIEAILSEIEDDTAGIKSRDHVQRLIASRATLRTVGSTPSIFAEKLSTLENIPEGATIYGRSAPSVASLTSSAGPWVCPASVRLMANGVIGETSAFPLPGIPLNNRALIVGTAIAFPLTVPANYSLFLLVGSDPLRISLSGETTPTSYASITELVAHIEAEAGGLVSALPYFSTNRLALVCDEPSLSILSSMVEEAGASSGYPACYTNSASSLLGFDGSETGQAGTTPLDVVIDGLNHYFASLVTVSRQGDAIVLASKPATIPSLQVQSPSGAFGFSTEVVHGSSWTIELYGMVGLSNIDPLDPVGFLDVADSIQTPSGTSTIASIGGGVATLSTPLQSFDGNISVSSSLVSMWNGVKSKLGPFMATWLRGNYSTDLAKLDAVIAPLYGSPTAARRAEALARLQELEDYLVTLQTLLTDYPLPVGAGTSEKSVVDDVLQTLRERKFDRAVALLLKCRIREVFSLDWQTASFSGEMLSAATDVSKLDIRWPNRSMDEGTRPVAYDDVTSHE